MSGTLTLAIDQGTHATRAIIFDQQGRPVASANRPVALQVHGRTVVEQSAEEILDSLHAVLGEVLQHPGVDPARIASAGLTTQRSSVLAWERRSGRALSPVLSWQDTRTSAEIAALYEGKLVLVRPDGHVAWRSDTPPGDASGLIDRVRGAL